MEIAAGDVLKFTTIFGMGAPQLSQGEVPRHRVRVDDFRIDKYLVTDAQFRRFADAHPQRQPERIATGLQKGNSL
jgi:formylglycine-generating enzyme required for sulfatase activity